MNIRSSNDVSCYPALSEVDSNHGNPCSLVGNSLFPKSGNTPGGPRKATKSRKQPRRGLLISVYFPSKSGIFAQRRVRYRLHAPPFSLPLRRFPARTRAQPEKSPRFRGVLAAKPSRIRTGDFGFRAWKTPHPAFFSVAKLGGSDPLSIRPSEGLGSADQYCKYEFHSLRGVQQFSSPSPTRWCTCRRNKPRFRPCPITSFGSTGQRNIVI